MTEENVKSVIGFLKYTFNKNNFLNYSKYGSHHYFKGYTILKNKFLINYNGNIILFELTNNNELKIISQSYFKDIISLKRFDEKNNKFYDDGSKENSYFSRWFSYKENENQNCIATIFY